MSALAEVLRGAGPWALAVGIALYAAWLFGVSGRVISRDRHREIIELYQKQAERDQETIKALNAQVSELMEHSRLAVQTWQAIREGGQS